MADNVDAVAFKEMPWRVKLMEDPAYYPTPTKSCRPKPNTENPPRRALEHQAYLHDSPIYRGQTDKHWQSKKFACRPA